MVCSGDVLIFSNDPFQCMEHLNQHKWKSWDKTLIRDHSKDRMLYDNMSDRDLTCPVLRTHLISCNISCWVFMWEGYTFQTAVQATGTPRKLRLPTVQNSGAVCRCPQGIEEINFKVCEQAWQMCAYESLPLHIRNKRFQLARAVPAFHKGSCHSSAFLFNIDPSHDG